VRRSRLGGGVTAAIGLMAVGAAAASGGCGSRTGLLVGDAPPAAEADAGAGTFPIYALVPTQASGEGTYDYSLSRFDPASATFGPLEPIPCLKAFGDQAISMAVGCDGAAYIEFARSGLWRVTPSPADCAATSFYPQVYGFDADLQLTFARTDTAEGESLFFVGTDGAGVTQFGTIDTGSLLGTRIARFGFAAADRTHLGGSPSGQVFAVTPGAIDVLDPSTGAGMQATTLPPPPSAHWTTQAFAFYRGSFYFFDIVPGPETTSVMRFTMGDAQATHVADTNRTVVAASAAPCP
jgi:hypothetical protein